MATKISVYSLSDLKNTLDDHIPLYLTSPNLGPLSVPLPKSLRFEQTHFHSNIRLALGYSAVALAVYIFYLDYYLKVSWADHKLVTAWAVLGYTILNGAMMAWSWIVERGLVFEGNRGHKAATAIRVYSLQPGRKYDPTYRLVVEWTKQRTEGRAELSALFTSFFQADGTFVAGEFERWLKAKVPQVFESKGETAEAVEKVEKKEQADDVDMDIVVVDGPTKDPSSGVETVQHTQGGKRRYRKNV